MKLKWIHSFPAAYNIFVEDFMVRNIKYIYNGMSFKDLKNCIKEGRRVRAFPLVDNPSKWQWFVLTTRFDCLLSNCCFLVQQTAWFFSVRSSGRNWSI